MRKGWEGGRIRWSVLAKSGLEVATTHQNGNNQ